MKLSALQQSIATAVPAHCLHTRTKRTFSLSIPTQGTVNTAQITHSYAHLEPRTRDAFNWRLTAVL